MKIRATARTDKEFLTIRAYTGFTTAIHANIVTFAGVLASFDIIHNNTPFAMELQPGNDCNSIIAREKNKEKEEAIMAEVKEKPTKIMLAAENQQELEEVMELIGELTPEEKRDFLTFLQAFRLAKSMIQAAPQTA